VQFDGSDELQGQFWITNSWIETGILTCRLLINFLEAKPSRHHDDVLSTMFRDAKGTSLKRVSVGAIWRFRPKGVSEDQTLERLNFTPKAADKSAFAFGGSEKEEEMPLYQIAAIAIHTATGYHLY
jgi:hypothetical protein